MINKNFFTLAFLFIITALVTAPLQLYAAENRESEQYFLEADSVKKLSNDIFEATGEAVIKADTIQIKADRIEYDRKKKSIKATGNVILISAKEEIQASSLTYSIDHQIGTAEDIRGFLAPFSFLCAKKMNRTGPDTFTVEDAKISTCSNKIPDWSLSMHTGSLQLEGYLKANHVSVNIADSPLVYLPTAFYPVSNKRKTGLLIPFIGYSTDLGAIANLKFFIAPDINYDFTLGLSFFSNRGVQEQAEARFALNEESQFSFSGEHLKDFRSEADTNSRWRSTFKMQYKPVKGLYLNFNSDYVSDFLYMRNFNKYSINSNGSNNTNNLSYIDANAKYYNDYADIQLQYRRDMIFKDISQGFRRTQLEQEPSINISKVFKEIPYIVIDYALSYDRLIYNDKSTFRQGETPNANISDAKPWHLDRLSAYAKISVPIDIKVLTITPNVNIGYIHWLNSTKSLAITDADIKKQEAEIQSQFKGHNFVSDIFGGVYRGSDDTSAYKYYGGAGLTLAIKDIFKNFGKVTHTLQNRLNMGYSPQLAQLNIPNLIKDDYTSYYGNISYEMINKLYGNGWSAKLTLQQGYDILKKENAVLPLVAELEIHASSFFSNTTRLYWKHSGPLDPLTNEKRFQYFINTTSINIYHYFYTSLSYSYDTRIFSANPTESNVYNTTLRLTAGLNIWRFAAQGYVSWHAYNSDISFNNLSPYNYGASLIFNADCWSLGVAWEAKSTRVNAISTEPYNKEEHRIYIMLSLKGITETNIDVNRIDRNTPIL